MKKSIFLTITCVVVCFIFSYLLQFAIEPGKLGNAIFTGICVGISIVLVNNENEKEV